MKNNVLTILLLLCSLIIFGQETEKKIGVLESDTTWLKEIIKFPISFAPEIKHEGYEDLRFAKDWRNKDHSDFWCYMFVWHVEGIQNPTAKDLELQMKFYYDGLMATVNKKKDFVVPKTTVLFIKTDDEEIDYIGKISVYDSFNNEDMMLLNVQVKVHNCDKENTSNIVFRLSPQEFNQPIWDKFKTIKLRDGKCKN